jgi:RNA polymerase sigma factor (sigma-70 family)
MRPIEGEGLDDENSLSELLDTSVNPVDMVLDQERRRIMLEAMEKLPPQMRRCMSLYLQAGLDYAEIAKILGVSIQTVRSQLSQAKERLRRTIERNLGNP